MPEPEPRSHVDTESALGRIRINYHALDAGQLIVEGVLPAFSRACARHGRAGVALRPHWLRGPHVVVTIISDALDSGAELKATFCQQIRRWISANPAPPLDDERSFVERCHALARNEDLSERLSPVSFNNTVVPLDYRMPAFRGDAALTRIRDAFFAECVDDIEEIIRARQIAPLLGIVALQRRFLLVERISEGNYLRLWPISPKAQVEATRQSKPEQHARFRKLCSDVEAKVISQFSTKWLWDTEFILSPGEINWLSKIGRLASTIQSHVLSPGSGRPASEGTAPAPDALYDADLGPSRMERIMRTPQYICYRIFINMLYAMFPVVGFGITERLLACHLITHYATELQPQVLVATKAYLDELSS